MAARLTRSGLFSVALILLLTAHAAAQNRRQDFRPDFQGVVERSPMSGLASQSRYSPSDQTPNSYDQPRIAHVLPYQGSPSCQRTRLQAVQEHYAIKQLYRDNRPPITRLNQGQLATLASVNAPEKIRVEFGAIKWPKALQRQEFIDVRAWIDQALYNHDDDGLRDLIERADATLRGMASKLPAAEYVAAVKFLRSLKTSV